MKYVVITEQGANSFGTYAPDLPGCPVVGETRKEALRLIREAKRDPSSEPADLESRITRLLNGGNPLERR